MLADKAGNLYGTTGEGGSGCGDTGCGTVFRLSPDGSVTTLYTFKGNSDGRGPGPLIADKAGNLYGVTGGGGAPTDGDRKPCENFGCGTVFRLAPDGTKTVLYAFRDGQDGAGPDTQLVFDISGNLYGATLEGGGAGCNGYGCGVVFKLAPDGTETVLHEFNPDIDGLQASALVVDRAGNLYGTTNV